MKEIKFRAKDFTGEWRYGYLVQEVDIENKPIKNFIIENRSEVSIQNKGLSQKYYGIDIETLGQYVGLKDKNGKDIYEGDVVKILYTDWTSQSADDARTLDEYLDSLTRLGVVFWDNQSLCYCLKFNGNYYGSIHCGKYGFIKVIGNVVDNTELLEANNED